MDYNIINIYEIMNVVYAMIITFIMFYVYKVPLAYYLIIFFHISAVFLTNDFLFSVTYMPDQIRYFRVANQIRETMDFVNYYQFDKSGLGNVSNAALIFAVFPIPFINSVFSIAIINSLFYSFMFIYLFRKKILEGNAIWFYLLYPSFALYAAIGGRDTLILIIMILSIYQLYKGNMIFSIIISSSLIFIKFQNFFIYIFSLLIYKSIDQSKFLSFRNFLKLIFIIIGFLVVVQYVSIEEINRFRYNMYAEDGGDLNKYIPISGFFDFIVTGLIGGIYMLFKPLIWESSNVLQLMQSFENIAIFYIIYKIIKKLKNVQDKFKYFLIIYFFIAMGIYGIVVFNFGTAARYKYTFVVIFILFSMKLIRDSKSRNQ